MRESLDLIESNVQLVLICFHTEIMRGKFDNSEILTQSVKTDEIVLRISSRVLMVPKHAAFSTVQ